MAVIKLTKYQGTFVFEVCNVVGSSIVHETNSGAYTHAGQKISVASTKVVTTQITVFILIALKLGNLKGEILNSTLYLI